MTTPEQLDHMLHELQRGKQYAPQDPEEKFTLELFTLAQHFGLHPDVDDALAEQFVPPSPARNVARWGRLAAVFAIGMLGLVLLVATVPTLRVLAQDVIGDLFPRDSHTRFEMGRSEDRLAFGSEDFWQADTLADLQAGVDYEIRQPDLTDMGFAFELGTLTIPRNSVQLDYSQPLPQDNRFWNLTIRQQPLEDAVRGVFHFTSEQDTISPEAETIPVRVAGYEGEAVQGDWFRSASASETLYFFWDENAWVYRLRWQDEQFLYEVELWTPSETAIDELVAIAELMMK